MTTPTREQVIAWAREAGFMTGTVDYADGEGAFPVAQARASGNCLHELVRLCTLAMSAGRAQGLREAGYPADFEPVEFLVGVEMWVKAAYQKGGDRLWKITRGFGEVLNKQGQWEKEPTASNRTDEFLARSRYATLDECAAAIEQLKGE